MQLTEQQIQDNWNKMRTIINNTFSGDRLENLNKMYDDLEDRMVMAPASGKEHFHNSFVGGYVDHVLHVVDFALKVNKIWKDNGAHINYTDEELIFAALHHDLGKVGDLEGEYYVPNDSDWHRKNQGLIFKHNDEIQYMTVTDRSVFLLNHYGVKMSKWEYLGLRLTDGMYEEANKGYYVSYSPGRQLKTNIAYILHQADMMASKIENDQWKRGYEVKKEEKKEVVEKRTEQSKKANQAFKELFGE